MPFIIEITDEDDFADILRKFRATGTEREITARVAAGALLFDDLRNLQELKKRTDFARKRVRIQTDDAAGAELARRAGYPVDLRTSSVPAQSVPLVIPELHDQHQALFVPEPISEAAPIVRDTPSSPVRVRKATNRVLFAVFSVAMIVLLLLAFVILPEADVTVYAKTEILSRDMQITVDANVTGVNAQQLVLPGTKLSNPQQYSQSFQSTGTSIGGQQATGTVQIYNFTGHVLKLGAATTTLTAGSATYHFTTDAANIPVTRYFAGSKTNVDPSSLGAPITVVANQAGDASNVPQGTRFEIKNVAFGSNPTTLYATSTTTITGGATGSGTAAISQNDQTTANGVLQKDLLAATEQQLLASKQLTLLDSGATVTSPAISFDQPVNAPVSSFTGTINATVSGLAFSKGDLVKLVEQRIALTLDPGMYLVTDQSSGNAETITESFSSYTPGNSSGVLMVHVDGLIASNVDTSNFSQQFKGKTIAEIQGILGQNAAVQGATITMKPFWVRNAPRFLNKIYITTQVIKPQVPSANPLNP